MHHNKAYVAVCDGKPVGIIIGTDIRKNKVHLSALAKTLEYGVGCLLDAELRENAVKWSGYQKISDEMDKIVQKETDGEISLFIVSPEYRGKGIGKLLYTQLLNHFRSIGIHNFYLHTDTACNYKFYEKQGMSILLSEKTNYSYAGTNDVIMFVMTGHI